MVAKKKIGLVQINNTLADMNYLPYAVGFLEAFVRKSVPDVDNKFEFMLVYVQPSNRRLK